MRARKTSERNLIFVGARLPAKTVFQALENSRMYRPLRGQARSYNGPALEHPRRQASVWVVRTLGGIHGFALCVFSFLTDHFPVQRGAAFQGVACLAPQHGVDVLGRQAQAWANRSDVVCAESLAFGDVPHHIERASVLQ